MTSPQSLDEDSLYTILSHLSERDLESATSVSISWNNIAERMAHETLHISKEYLDIARIYSIRNKNTASFQNLIFDLSTPSGWLHLILILDSLAEATREKIQSLKFYSSQSHCCMQDDFRYIKEVRERLCRITSLVLMPIDSQLAEETLFAYSKIVSLTIAAPKNEETEWRRIELDQLKELTVLAPLGNGTFIGVVDRYIIAPSLQNLTLATDLNKTLHYVRCIARTYGKTIMRLRIIGVGHQTCRPSGRHFSASPLLKLEKLQELCIETCWLSLLLPPIVVPERPPFPALQTLILEERWVTATDGSMDSFDWTAIRSLLDAYRGLSDKEDLNICCGYPQNSRSHLVRYSQT
ncbi:hypothetical protein PM082_012115 [Marasmius tenuissimus]|nr:hypothetical protein PM082_012115 [Marasmius tenuissimus]